MDKSPTHVYWIDARMSRLIENDSQKADWETVTASERLRQWLRQRLSQRLALFVRIVCQPGYLNSRRMICTS